MPWFERPFLAVLRHEYRASMRFTEDDAASRYDRAEGGQRSLTQGGPELDAWNEEARVSVSAITHAAQLRATATGT